MPDTIQVVRIDDLQTDILWCEAHRGIQESGRLDWCSVYWWKHEFDPALYGEKSDCVFSFITVVLEDDVIELTEEAEEFDDENDRWLRTFSSPVESDHDDA